MRMTPLYFPLCLLPLRQFASPLDCQLDISLHFANADVVAVIFIMIGSCALLRLYIGRSRPFRRRVNSIISLVWGGGGTPH